MKVLAITGGGAGIGRGIAYHFAQHGYAVSIADKDKAAGEEARAHIEAMGSRAIFAETDVSREKDVRGFGFLEVALKVRRELNMAILARRLHVDPRDCRREGNRSEPPTQPRVRPRIELRNAHPRSPG